MFIIFYFDVKNNVIIKILFLSSFFCSCTLIFPLSVVDNSPKMSLLTVEEYFGGFNTLDQVINEFGNSKSVDKTKFTQEYKYYFETENSWQKSFVVFSVNEENIVEKYYGKGMEYGLPRYIEKNRVRETRMPLWILGGVLDFIGLTAFYTGLLLLL